MPTFGQHPMLTAISRRAIDKLLHPRFGSFLAISRPLLCSIAVCCDKAAPNDRIRPIVTIEPSVMSTRSLDETRDRGASSKSSDPGFKTARPVHWQYREVQLD